MVSPQNPHTTLQARLAALLVAGLFACCGEESEGPWIPALPGDASGDLGKDAAAEQAASDSPPDSTDADSGPVSAICNSNGQCEGVENASNCPTDCAGACLSPEVKTLLSTIWKSAKPYLIDRLNESLSKAGGVAGRTDPYVLYNTQLYTNNLLTYAHKCNDLPVLDDLAELILTSFPYLESPSQYVYHYPTDISGVKCADTVLAPLQVPGARMWIYHNDPTIPDYYESYGPSGQFLYLVASAIHIFAGLQETDRTAKMTEVISKFTSVAVEDHYLRWIYRDKNIFQVKAWGCEEYCASPNYNHYDFLQKKLKREFGTKKQLSHCNIYTDYDMWILAGAVEILAAQDADPVAVPLSSDTRKELKDYVTLAIELTESRSSTSALTNFSGQAAVGLNVDLGSWDDHMDYSYAGYEGETFPTEADKKPPQNVGWDLSHARRFVQFFRTLHDNRSTTGQDFPSASQMTQLANQLAYGVFDRDFDRPRFRNFMDGANGWYRVGYSGREGFGYPPFGMSTSYLTGGYAFWAEYNPDVARLSDSLWRMLLAIWNNDDQAKVDFARENYASEVFSDYSRDTSLAALQKQFNKTASPVQQSLNLLMFLPSLAARP